MGEKNNGCDVSITSCFDYSEKEAERAMREVLEPIGGLCWIEKGMKIVIKANLVSMLKPDSAATTHPALICALTRLLKEKGAEVIIGDSPGGIYTSPYLAAVYSATGMRSAEKCGAQLNRDFFQAEANFPLAKVAKNFVYTSYLDKADAIINFCKLKTHGMMAMSAAAKNMFGTIPGTIKPEYHYKYSNPEDFAGMIVDLNEYFKPRLNIVDAVIGMEGNGPTMGKPRYIGAILASPSPHKLDIACARLIGLSIEEIPTLKEALRRELIDEDFSKLKISGNLEQFIIPDFDNIGTRNSIEFLNRRGPVAAFLKKALTSIPKVKKSDCVGCKKCAEICPAHAIKMENRVPNINRKICIRCFCCQEFCPKGAMKVHRTWIARALNRNGGN